MNYTDIQKAIIAYSGRTDSDYSSAVPAFIAQIQSKLDQELRISALLQVIAQPAEQLQFNLNGFLQVETVLINNLEGILMPIRDVLRSRAAVPDPQIYAMSGWAMLLAYPSAVSVHGYVRPTPISANNASNAYSQYAPNAIIFGALAYGAIWAKDDESQQTYTELYENEVQTLNEAHQAFLSVGDIGYDRTDYI